jgi:hypothetical protein
MQERIEQMTYRNRTKQFSILLALLFGFSAEASFVPAMAQDNARNTAQGNGPSQGNVSEGRRRNQGQPRRPSALGPGWIKGQDGAQNVMKLKRAMKVQSKRADHQYQQAMLQVKEQQQQQYEKEMLQSLGRQRPVIEQNRTELKQVRQDTGANN